MEHTLEQIPAELRECFNALRVRSLYGRKVVQQL
jgi:hypothetical protein